jgi:hypothetical protein
MTTEEIELFGSPIFNKGPSRTTTATHRRCTTCRQWKEYSEYHKNKNHEPQIKHNCKMCIAEKQYKKTQAKYKKIEKIYGKITPKSYGILTETHKRCPKCLEWKTHDQFQKNKTKLMNLAIHCASCTSVCDLQKRYGIGLEEFTDLLAKQGGGCAICGAARGSKKVARLFVDHDHKTGKVRGLLCSHCNSMLGHSRDKVSNLRRGIQYLERASK